MKNSLVSEFWKWCSSTPDSVALFDSEKPISYKRLGTIANSIIQALRGLDVPEKSRLLIIGDRDARLYASLIAGWTVSMGTCILSVDISFQYINKFIQLIRPSAIVDLRDLGCRDNLFESLIWQKTIVNCEFNEVSIFSLKECKILEVAEGYIVRTSGSTGAPKFISILQSSVQHFLDVNSIMRPINPSDIATQIFPSSFDLFYYDVLTTLNSGAALVIIREEDIWKSLDIASRLRVTLWFSVPSVARLIQRTLSWETGIVPPFRRILFCGEPLPKKLVMNWAIKFPLAKIENLYGPAEVTMACTSYSCTPHLEEIEDEIIPIGALFPGLRAILRDQESRFIEVGAGELCIAGIQVMSEYLDIPDENGSRDVFIFYDGYKFYNTGDTVHRDADGIMHFIGRSNRQFKYSGVNIEPEQIERVVLQISEISEVAVVPKYSNDGVSTQGFTLYWSMEADNKSYSLPEESINLKIIQSIQEQISSFYVPQKILYMKQLPRKDNGKINYGHLSQLERGSEYSDDFNVIAKQIIANSLELDIEKILDTDRIHEYRQWDSLGHLKIVTALEEHLGCRIDPQDCFSVTSIAKLVKQRKKKPLKPVVQAGLHGVWIARTSICDIDPNARYFRYRGYDVSFLIQEHTFSSVAFLLNVGKLPSLGELENAKTVLQKGYCCQNLPTFSKLNQALLCISLLNVSNDCDEFFKENPQFAAFWLIGRLLATVGASSKSVANGVATALLSLVNRECDDVCLTAMEQILIILADHGACASTTALRCVASTEALPTHAIVAALSAFSGTRHGGAIVRASTALAMKASEHEEAWEYDKNRPPPGFGHRVYVGTDPRCDLLSDILRCLSENRKVANNLHCYINFVKGKEPNLNPNVDLFAAAILSYMGFSPELMQFIFSVARIAGWSAHYLEHSSNNILIRPRLLFDSSYGKNSGKVVGNSD